MRSIPLLTVVAAGLALTGCGQSGPRLYPVEGKVTLTDGTPVPYGHIILQPDVSKGNTSKEVSTGTIRDGAYIVLTGARKGAPAGVYKVSIEAAQDVDANYYFTKWLADEKYNDPNRSNLTLTVVENPEAGRYDFRLVPHRARKK